MARRPASVLIATLGVGMLALPAVLLGGQQPAAAAAGAGQQQSQSPATITISAMTPQWAKPTSTITVSGTVRNTSGQRDARVTVQLLGSAAPVTSVAQLELNASLAYSPATTTLPGAVWQSSGQLAPGTAADWSIRVPASALGMTAFGVYPLAAEAESAYGSVLATTTTYLPYEPARKGPYASTRPSPAQTAWLWPLIDVPLLNEPWQGNCSGQQAGALAQSLGNGRLSQLVGAGALTQTTESLAAAAGRSRAAAHTGAAPPQSLADYDGVTWVVDPALLANVQALHYLWCRAATVGESRVGLASRTQDGHRRTTADRHAVWRPERRRADGHRPRS